MLEKLPASVHNEQLFATILNLFFAETEKDASFEMAHFYAKYYYLKMPHGHMIAFLQNVLNTILNGQESVRAKNLLLLENLLLVDSNEHYYEQAATIAMVIENALLSGNAHVCNQWYINDSSINFLLLKH